MIFCFAPAVLLSLSVVLSSPAHAATSCTSAADCNQTNSESCCSWNNQVGAHTTGNCGQMCTASTFQTPQNCTSNGDCQTGETCCSWSSSFAINTQGVCGQVCAVGSFSMPSNCTSSADCTGGKSCCNWDSSVPKWYLYQNGVCGQTCSSTFCPTSYPVTNCSSNSDCSAIACTGCCNWDNRAGAHTTGQCGQVCAAGSYQPAVACTVNSQCGGGQTCCSWSSSLSIHTRGVCGQICAAGSFSVPSNCTSNSDCTGGKSCCNWDNALAMHTNGVCGQVCTQAFVAPTTTSIVVPTTIAINATTQQQQQAAQTTNGDIGKSAFLLLPIMLLVHPNKFPDGFF